MNLPALIVGLLGAAAFAPIGTLSAGGPTKVATDIDGTGLEAGGAMSRQAARHAKRSGCRVSRGKTSMTVPVDRTQPDEQPAARQEQTKPAAVERPHVRTALTRKNYLSRI